MKRLLAILLALTMLFLAGCGAKEMASDNGANMDRGDSLVSGSGQEDAGASQQEALPEDQKLIRKLWLTAETEDLDALLSQVEQQVKSLNGYMENREIENYDADARHAELTIRIPAQSLDQFAKDVEKASNVTSTTETTENITLSYVAVESRMKALETEQTRLLELLAKAENMTEILQIEERLTKVRTELEQVTSQLRLYDNQVSYSTVYLTLYEVREYTEEAPEGFFERIGSGFMESLKGVGNGLKEFVIFVIVASPYLILFAVIGVGIALIVRGSKKKKAAKAKKEAKE